jgi:hypothetical protein
MITPGPSDDQSIEAATPRVFEERAALTGRPSAEGVFW